MQLGTDDHDTKSTSQDIHRYMVPIMGLAFTLVFLILAIVLALRPGLHAILRWLGLALCVIETFVLVFFWFNLVWDTAFWLTVCTIFGIYAFLTFERDHLKLFTISAVFNLLVVLGYLRFLGWAGNVLDLVLNLGECKDYYDVTDAAICHGYLNFLQFLAFLLMILQALLALIGYVTYKSVEAENGSPN
eukprot:TRINITY_DN74_c0_g2_i2.p1 TRINITY_DN74_c0_g2~~TRINITY_DN74_c0_g2_i2.p1  ORF type:complete len:216 (+),score=23.84 TRINITY_DN74_c0_g2_i2:83-649(+)